MRPLILHGHERAITYLKYSPDGDVFFSAAKDEVATMWRADTGERIGVFKGHTGAVSQLDTTRIFLYFLNAYDIDDTKYLISASMDSTCHIWEVNTGKVVKVLEFGVPLRCVAVSEGDKYLCLSTQSFARESVFSVFELLFSLLFIYTICQRVLKLSKSLLW